MKISNISGQTLLKYFQNNLSVDEKKNVAKSIAEDRLYSDAAEGFENHPEALNDLGLMKDRFYFNKGIRNNIVNKYVFIMAGVLSIAFTCLIIYYKIKTPDVFKNDRNVPEKVQSSVLPENEIMPESEISNALPLDAKIQITSKSILKNQPQTIVIESKNEEGVITPISSKKIQDVSQKNSAVEIEKELDKKLIIYSNYPVIYLIDLKVVDYSKVYKNRPVIPEGSGLESKFESSESKTVFTYDDRLHYMPYKSFLEAALQKYSAADFKGAIRDFYTVLKTFPSDLNAYFYGGLCLYNLQKTEKAIAFFDQVIESPINSFCQEAKWYKALALIQKNDLEKAKQLLLVIIEEDGFYAEKAKSYLKNLK